MKEAIIQYNDTPSGGHLAISWEPLVRCKDCKHRPVKPNDYENGFDLAFPDNKCPCQCGEGWYSWYPGDDWFCAEGERRTDDA